jgi:Holliday junction resolvase RusA-like endonuclease
LILTLDIPGVPQGKGRLRHRVVRSKANPLGYASGYTPAATIAYEEQIAVLARLTWGRQFGDGVMLENDPPLLDGPIFLHVIAYKPIPESWSRAKKAAAERGDIRPTSKPDWDNFGKVAADALNTIAFKDDAQVADAFVQKYYSDTPRMRIVVQVAKVDQHGCPSGLVESAARAFADRFTGDGAARAVA